MQCNAFDDDRSSDGSLTKHVDWRDNIISLLLIGNQSQFLYITNQTINNRKNRKFAKKRAHFALLFAGFFA
jgi:hypothetical protein